jgi:hypothetical protein
MQADPEQRSFALKTLVRLHQVFPELPEMEQTYARLPGLYETFGAKLVDVAGVSSATVVRKL